MKEFKLINQIFSPVVSFQSLRKPKALVAFMQTVVFSVAIVGF